MILAAHSNAVDVFTGESINQTNYILTDGEYSWGSALCYYIKKYNLQLPEYFEKKILDNLNT